ncbi:MAG: HEAT repeat domain-containing protein, partial [Dehalococcoidia bacterium]|nr:HEAT repeat domain-containing protein [Dehalococcoidia bacterium]
MDTHKGEVKNRDPQITEARLAREALNMDITRASQGDVEAAAGILSKLAGEDRRAQAIITSAVLTVADPALWEYLLEFACSGTWAGKSVDLPDSISQRILRPKLASLFLARQDGPSAASRYDVLIRGLSSREACVRHFALDLLGQWPSRVDLESLIPLLHDPDMGVRLRAARALGKTGDARAVPALIDALGHSDDLIAGEATDALALIGEAALEPLIRALQVHDPYVRWHAAKALAEMADPRAAGALIDALDDQNFGVRWTAANGLVALGRQALAPLLRALRIKETTPWLAEAAIHVLKN